MVGSWCSTMYRRRRLHATRSWSRLGVQRSIIWILLRPPEQRDRYSHSTCRGYLVMSFQGSSNRLAVTLRHMPQVSNANLGPLVQQPENAVLEELVLRGAGEDLVAVAHVHVKHFELRVG